MKQLATVIREIRDVRSSHAEALDGVVLKERTELRLLRVAVPEPARNKLSAKAGLVL